MRFPVARTDSMYCKPGSWVFPAASQPLPGYYLDQMAQESAQNEDGLKEFLDLFSHRWTQFAYHACSKYRYYICFP